MSVTDFVSLTQGIFTLVADFLLSTPMIYFVGLALLLFSVYIFQRIIFLWR